MDFTIYRICYTFAYFTNLIVTLIQTIKYYILPKNKKFKIIFLKTCNLLLGFATLEHDKVVVCYVASWATYRLSNGAFSVENVHPEHCTNLVYAFAGLDTASWTIKSTDPWTDTEKDGNRNEKSNHNSQLL